MDSPSKLRTAHQVAVSASAVPAALAAAAAAATTTSGLSLTRQPPPPTSYGSSAFAAAAAAAAAGGAHRGAAGPPPPPQHSSEQIAAAVRYYSAAAGSAAAAQHPHSREPAYIRAAQVRFLCLLLRPDEWGDRIDIPELDRSPRLGALGSKLFLAPASPEIAENIWSLAFTLAGHQFAK